MAKIILRKKTKIKLKDTLTVLIFLIPYFEPLSLRYLFSDSVATFFEYWRVINGLIVIGLYLGKFKSISRNIFFLGIFIFCYISISIINSPRWTLLTFFIVDISSLFMFFEMKMKLKGDAVIVTLFNLLAILVLINFICLIVRPEGVYITKNFEVWNDAGYYNVIYDYVNFLERDNRLMDFLMPFWFAMMICYSKEYIKKITAILVMAVIDITLIWVWSATSLIGATIITIAFAEIVIFKSNLKRINFKKVFYIIGFCNFMLIFLKIENVFSYFIESILKKSVTLTGRTGIWEIARKMIMDSPIIGYGTREKGYIVNGFYAHNLVLDIMIQGGILLLVTFILFIFSCHKTSAKYDNKLVAKIMLVAVMAWGVMALTESFFYQYSFWITLSIWNNVKYFENQNSNEMNIKITSKQVC